MWEQENGNWSCRATYNNRKVSTISEEVFSKTEANLSLGYTFLENNMEHKETKQIGSLFRANAHQKGLGRQKSCARHKDSEAGTGVGPNDKYGDTCDVMLKFVRAWAIPPPSSNKFKVTIFLWDCRKWHKDLPNVCRFNFYLCVHIKKNQNNEFSIHMSALQLGLKTASHDLHFIC